MSNEKDAEKVGQMLIEFFHLNKISRNAARTAMLGLYMSVSSEMGISYKDMEEIFNICLEHYKQG